MAIVLSCRKHPKYKAMGEPRRTTKHPEGCPGCNILWRATFGTGALIFTRRNVLLP